MSREFEVVIGLEVHVELATASKIFCGCPNAFGAPPNTQVCPVCLGLPGSLPVLNRRVAELALCAALALECRPVVRTKFDRKNYFYPDLPKAYQISQFDLPLARQGRLLIDALAGPKWIGITRVHMEEDAGKLLHQGEGGRIGSADSSLVDYNRAGVPLIEIVSEPDLRSAEEAYAYLTELKAILQYTRVSDCSMEQGSLRCDANISVRPAGQQALGTKAELKNMNSFKHVRAGLEYEAARQIQLLSQGRKVTQETRLWDPDRGVSHPMRGKEEAHDYRYFPEPDLPEIEIAADWLEEIKNKLPELPRERRERFRRQYGLNEYDAGVLTQNRLTADFFEETVQASGNAKASSNWINVEYQGRLNAGSKQITEAKVSPKHLGELIKKIDSGEISGKQAKQIFDEMYSTGQAPENIIAALGMAQITDAGAIQKIVEQVLAAHPGPAADFRSGKTAALGFLVGQVMKASSGQANPQLVNQALRKALA